MQRPSFVQKMPVLRRPALELELLLEVLARTRLVQEEAVQQTWLALVQVHTVVAQVVLGIVS